MSQVKDSTSYSINTYSAMTIAVLFKSLLLKTPCTYNTELALI